MSLLGNLKSFIRQIDISATIAALCFFLCMLPYFVWENKFAVYAQVVFVLIAILNCHSKERKSGALIALACLYIYIIFRNNYSNGEIGRAVQQECRDRSRMPSSA